MVNIKNLPVISHKDITETPDNYRVSFHVTEFQADEIFGKYKVEVRGWKGGIATSFDEAFSMRKPECPKDLEVKDVVSLVRVLWIERATPDYLIVSSASYWILYNGQLLKPSHNKSREPYRFYLVGETPYSHGKNQYFKYNEPEPNRVGKATEKKIKAWADYLNAKEAAMQAYIKENKDKKAAFFARLDASGLEYKRNGNEVLIYNGCLTQKVTIGENDVYPHQPEFDYYRCDSPIRRKEGKTSLDFMLENSFPIIPRK